MASVHGLVLLAKGDVKKIKLPSLLTEKQLQDSIKKKTTLENLGSYTYNEYILTLFGYTTGKEGTENKHELPPPLDSTLYFSDILLIACNKDSSWKHPVTFTQEEYETFYQKAFGGFEEDDGEDDGDEEEEDVENISIRYRNKLKILEENFDELG